MKKCLQRPGSALFLIGLLTLLTRLPAVFSPNFYLDGDEAIVGLMTLDFAHGKLIPGYFYGQLYGLSFFETLVALPGQMLAPGNIYVFKLSILILFIIGVWFLWLYLKELLGFSKAWLGVVFIILLPGWYLWSMKGRGGYVTAFTFFNLVLWLTETGYMKKKWPKGLVLGMAMNVIWLAQPLWLLGTIPFLLKWLGRQRVILKLGAFILGFLALYVIWSLITNVTLPYIGGNSLGSTEIRSLSFNALMDNFRHAVSGAYYLLDFGPSVGATTWIGWVGVGLVLVLILGIVTRLINRWNWFEAFFLIVLLGSFAQVIPKGFEGARYYLPILELMVIGVLIILPFKAKVSWWVLLPIFFFLVPACISLSHIMEQKRMRVGAHFVDEIQSLERQLLKKNIYHTYSSDPLLQWQILFVSNQKISSRWIYSQDREQPYASEVDEALHSGKKIALIGFYNDYRRDQLSECDTCRLYYTPQKSFYYWPDPTGRWLRDSGFDIPNLPQSRN